MILSSHPETSPAPDPNQETNIPPPLLTVENGKDGTVWTVLGPGEYPGRRQSQNVLTEATGPTPYAKRNIYGALTAFLCLFDLEHDGGRAESLHCSVIYPRCTGRKKYGRGQFLVRKMGFRHLQQIQQSCVRELR